MNVFISYRRSESAGDSGRICDRLRADLPDAKVFMDVDSIEAGSDWRAALAQRIAAADVVLVLVGREWLTLTDARGLRRIDDPCDVTRWEIESALKQAKRVIPVFLQEVASLPADELPASLKPLAALQAIPVRHESFNAGLESLIAQITGETFTRRRWILERARRWSVPAIGLVVVLLAWTRLFDLLTLDTRLATWTLAVADALSPPLLDDSIVLVGITPDRKATDPQMRTQYAALLTHLARAGAKAAVMDIHFHAQQNGDAVLADAMSAARSRGMAVFFSFVETIDGTPRSAEPLGAAATRIGLACAGRRLGYSVSMPIAFDVRQRDNAWSVHPSPSLALLGAVGAATVSSIDAAARSITLSVEGGSIVHYGFTLLRNPIEGKQACAALSPGTRTAELMLRTSSLDTLRARRVDFGDILAQRIPAVRFAGKTVVIGFETPQEMFRVAHGLRRENRFGYELHADTINILKTRRITRLVDPLAQAAIALALATLGAGLGVRFRKLTRGRSGALVLALLLAYAAAAIALAAGEDILLNSAYDISAFVFAYVLFRHLAKRWQP